MTSPTYHFGPYRLDLRAEHLLKGSEALRISEKAIKVLSLLVRNAGEVVGRAALLDHAWPHLDVSETVLTRAVSELRRAFDDHHRAPKYIETVHGLGFRFIAQVHAAQSVESIDELDVRGACFVGRAVALAELHECWASALRSEACVSLVSGPAGIGKSRLLQEFVNRIEPSNPRLAWVRLSGAEQHGGFWMWDQILESLLPVCSAAELHTALGWAAGDVAAALPILRPYLDGRDSTPALDPALARARLFTGIASFLSHLTESSPLILVLDDLHCAAPSSLSLLDAALSSMRGQRLLVLCARRDDEPARDERLEALLDGWRGNVRLREFKLTPLSDTEASALIEASALGPLPAALAARITRDTAGNPFFLLQMIASLRGARWPASAISDYRMPESVRLVIEHRVHARSLQARALVEAGAILGVEFDARLAASLAGVSRSELAEPLTEILAAGFVEELPDDVTRLRFRHDLVRETILLAVPAGRRALLHRRAGEILEGSGSVSDLAQLAYHFSQAAAAGGSDKALTYALRAGEEALVHYSHESALHHLSRALELASRLIPANDDRWCRLLESVAELRVRLGEFEEAEAIAHRLLAMAEAERRPEWLAAGAIALARCYLPYRPKLGEAVIDALERACQALGDAPTMLRALVRSRLAVALLAKASEDDRRIELARAALAYGRGCALPDRVRLNFETIVAFWDADHLDERDTIARELAESAEVARRGELTVAAHGWEVVGHLSRGEFAAADHVLSISNQNPHLHNPFRRRYQLRFEIQLAVVRGRLDHAEELIAELSRLPEHLDRVSGPLELLFAQLMVKRERGQLDGVDMMIRALAMQFPVFPLRWALPLTLVEAGRFDEARTELEALASRGFEDLPPRNEVFGWLAAVATCAVACGRLGAKEHAPKLYHLLLPYERRWAVLHFGLAVLCNVSRALGGLASTMGRSELAESHFQLAAEQCDREHAIPELARIRLDRARALLGLQPDGRARAAELRRQVLESAERHQLEAIRRAATMLETEGYE